MNRIVPMGSKFKRIEIAMRQTLHAYTKAMYEVDHALAGPRSIHEKEWLNSIKMEWHESRQKAVAIIQKLFTE